MPITPVDLSMYGQQKPIPILSPDQIALQQANEEAKRDALRQKRQALLDDAATRRAMQESIDPNTGAVDYGRLSGLLGKYGASPATIEGVQTKIDTHIEKLLTQQKLRDEHNAAYQKFVAERIGAIDSQDKLDMARELYPDLAGALPKDFENGKPQIALLAQSASTESEKATIRKQAAEELRASRAFDAGTPERLANGLAATAKLLANDTPDGYQQAMNGGLKTLGIDDAIIARLPPQYDPQKLAALSMTPKDQAELAGQAESRAQVATNNETLRAQGQQRLGIEAQNAATSRGQLAVAQQRENRETKAAAATAATGAGLAPPSAAVAEYVKNVQSGKWLIGNVPLKERDAVATELNRSGVDVAKLTAADWGMKTQATQMLPMIDKTQELAKRIDALGLAGTIGGRWRQIVAGESLGSSLAGLTPDQKATVGEFATQVGLLVTGIARAHGGARAGGSPQMVEELKKYLDAANKDYDTFRGNLNGARNFMNTYAHMGEPAKTPDAAGALPPVNQRVAGKTTATIKGIPMIWDGGAWVKK